MKKVVFIAIIAYTGEVTHDGRVLVTPEADECGRRKLLHRKFPLPVIGQHEGGMVQVGQIEMAALCDRRVIVFGHLDPRPEFEWIRRGLDRGGYWLEIDVDDIRIDRSDDTLRLLVWRLTGAHVGMSPAWRLPSTQIGEWDVKEKIDA